MNYRITLAYDGTQYCGWQMQLGRPTVQAVLSQALHRLAGAPVVTFAAGRTDAGVHAEGQVVSFRLSREWEGWALRRALNGNLPPDIRVLDAAPAAPQFHARFDAKSKTYRYRLYTGAVMSPFEERYAWHYPFELESARLLAEGLQLVGTHDFSAFTVAACEVNTHVRTVTGFQVEQAGPVLHLYFSGEGFLRYQVRTMVGALVAANRGRLKAGSIQDLLASGKRKLAGAPAPAKGLTLIKVEY
jgi:tRNA pseudouridine38-40 synthase